MPFIPAFLYIGGTGNVAVIMSGGEDPITFVGLVAGTILPIRPSRVMSTNTSGSMNIVACR